MVKVKEEITKILSDESLTTIEEKVDAIAKGLATLVIPKDKYNELSNKLKITETKYAELLDEYDAYKKSKMTEEEKAEEERKKFEEEKKANAIAKSKLAVKELLLDNGIKVTDEDIELKETLENIISDDYEKSIKLANSFISILKKTKETTQKETVTDLLNDTPHPIGGNNASNPVNKLDELKQKLEEAIKNKDEILQTQLTREIFEEMQKNNL